MAYQLINPYEDEINIKKLHDIIRVALLDLKTHQSKSKQWLYLDFYLSPLGTMCLLADDKKLVMLEFVDRRHIDKEINTIIKKYHAKIRAQENLITAKAKDELHHYFLGHLKQFTVPVAIFGTDFQIDVWHSLLEIPYGETLSYAKQAKMIGRKRAVRAVANANGMNRVAIIFPCHRVIGSDGSLTGYAGRIERKAWLLSLEKSQE